MTTLELANKLFLQGKVRDSAALYAQTIKNSPESWAAYLSGARAYDRLGDRTAAVRLLRDGLVHPRLPLNHAAVLWLELGRMAADLHKDREAILAFNVCVYLAGTDPDVYARRAEVLSRAGRYKEALLDCADAIQMAPSTNDDLSEIYMFRADILIHLAAAARTVSERASYLDQAEGDLGQAIFLCLHRHNYAQTARLYLKRAQMYKALNDTEQADRDEREATRLRLAFAS
jgi:tetratricopeptide (TPR) repeat protein